MLPKAEAAGVQGDEALALVVAPGAKGYLAAVKFVAEQRMTAAGALHADLVGATGFQGDFEEGSRGARVCGCGSGVGGRGSGVGTRDLALPPTPDSRPPTPAWGVSATAALYRREALGETIFDETLFAYYEDVELNARLHESGWRTAVLPVIKATHLGSQSAPLLGADALRLRTRNRYLVARRHPGVGRIGALLLEDIKLALHGRTSIRGMLQGLFTR